MNATISNEELWHVISLLLQIDKHGNDGADIFEYEEYERFLIEKYGETVKEPISLAYARCSEHNTTNKQIETKKMAGINFNATEVAPNVGFAPVEKGKYTVVMSKSEFKPTSNGAGKFLETFNTIQGGANHGRNILVNFNWENPNAKCVEIGRGQFSAVCHAVNVLHVQDTQQLHNIPYVLEVDITPDEKYNEVVGIYPLAQAPQPQQVQQPQPQFAQPNIAPAGPYAGYQQPAAQPQPQFMPQPQFAPQGQANPVMQQPQPQQQFAPTGQTNPMAAYEQMAQPQQVQQPVMTQAAPTPEVPDWIKNQMNAQQPGNA